MMRLKYPAEERRESDRNRSQLGTTSAAQTLPVQTQIVSNWDGNEGFTSFPSSAYQNRWDYTSQKALRGGGGGRDAMAESLPLEILTYILSFLPLSDQKEASLVSQAWYCAAQNAFRETNVWYNIPVSSASLPAIKSLGLRGISCISLTILDGSPASHRVLKSVAYHMGPHLQSLCLSGGSPTEAPFVALILGCPALRILDLSGCNSLFTSSMLLAQPETAQRVQQALSGLCEFNLASLQDLADLSFNRLSSCAPSLERLSLAYCHLTFEQGPARGSIGPQDSSPSQLSFHNRLRFVKERAGRLCALDLSGTGLPPEALQALGQVAGLQLQELSLHSCQDLSTEAHLSLRKLQRLTDAGCSALGGLRELQSLNMAERCQVRGRELAQALGLVQGAPPPLASLSLAYCSSLKDASVFSLIPVLSPSLRVLDLSSCVALTNQTMQAICTYLTHLSVLRLAWCKELHDWGLLGLRELSEEALKEPRGFFPQPHRELEHQASSPKNPSPQPQDPSLLTWQALRELDLTACSKLTDASLTKVWGWGLEPGAWANPLFWPPCRTLETTGQACKQLQTLDVAMCPGIGMASVRCFQAQLPQVTCVQSRFVGGADLTLTL
ncbi:Leucine-rich repeat-containing protein 29 [Camelus dromedarius]|uniref:Leucine-rich repeat-containing protein 29 n=1 Tax=Camelus dromedarius TaxID=9838 RepID=A0A5N4DQX2_CAMDR|nr:Leucine-rich repeat-containing protein 29 [Camelus dromedarius]